MEDESIESSRILQRLKVDGVEELSRLFMLHRPMIRNMVTARLHGRICARVDASDIVQETYIRASKSLGRYLESPGIHPVVWLRNISKQLLAESLRGHFRQKRTPQREEHDTILEEIADSVSSAEDSLVRQELVQRVRTLMAELAPMDQEILEMRHSEGYSFREIADTLELKEDTAKKRYYRALSRFGALADDDDVVDAG